MRLRTFEGLTFRPHVYFRDMHTATPLCIACAGPFVPGVVDHGRILLHDQAAEQNPMQPEERKEVEKAAVDGSS
eukprot:scaffold16413_cov15-Tisochrysis_lutea.AAC.4